jgi:ABC-2 type transport system ATP-binding protein
LLSLVPNKSGEKRIYGDSLAVRARGFTKCFGDVVALDCIDLDVAQGQIHGLVGPNGAGKTTLLGLLLGLAVADSGRLEVLGTPVGRALAIPDGVAGFVDGPGLYPSLTARQNLAALATLRHDARTAGIDEALDQVGLTDVADDRVRGWPGACLCPSPIAFRRPRPIDGNRRKHR